MRRLTRQIEQLLYTEECVVVPGIGGFLVHHEPAVADEQKGLIYPGHCRISFNAALKDNDGVLVKSYSDAFSFGYRRSLSIMEKDIEELRAQLLSSGVVEIGEVGKLVQSKGEMNLTFIPNPHHPFSIDYYGLRPVAMLPRPKAATKVPEQRAGLKGHIYYLPINLRTLGYGSVAAAMVAMAIFIPNQKLQSPSNVTQYQAGFLTEQVAEQKEEPTPVVEEVQAPTFEGFRITEGSEQPGRYYVVVATLPNEAMAHKFINENSNYLRFAGEGGVLVSSRGLHRFYAASFETSEEAQTYLRELTKEEAFSTAWIHKQ
ncbi:hypothetical protein [Porphyromonas somerae]|uniref:HU domain-containing protein n=1 Tax=Porphyromonas somerae TaxID=322095 RepID=UPI002A750CB5|nr:hypothetical protein [Porphyromonas somerae]MDY3119860.1 hypothetical protein [Porphyromonas somerae]